MNTKLMVELLRRGKNGDEILKILEAVTSEAGKISEEVKEMVTANNYAVSEPTSF